MAFNSNKLIKIGPVSTLSQFNDLALPGDGYLTPQLWLYNAATDTAATLLTNGYFHFEGSLLGSLFYNNGSQFRVGDVIYCVCSDSNIWVNVTTAGTDVITVAQGSGPDSVATADIQNLAVTAAKLAADAVTTAKILDANVTLAKLAAGITPSHVIKFAGQVTSVGGAAAEAFAVAGAVAATDRAFCQVVDDGPNNRTILQAVVTNNVLTITFSGDPGAGTIVNYHLIRAAS